MSNWQKLIVANWKMNKTALQAQAFLKEFIAKKGNSENEIVVCAPFVDIFAIERMCHENKIKIGAQNCYFEQSGAFTGEISASMLGSLNVDYVILGHSERRKYFMETDQIINKKIKAVVAANMSAIVCVGESRNDRDHGKETEKVLAQVHAAIDGLPLAYIKSITIAYEPVWAIGTGKTVTPCQANEICKAIKDYIFSLSGNGKDGMVRTIYGGSVCPSNVQSFLSAESIDGALVGGASLNVDEFLKIIL